MKPLRLVLRFPVTTSPDDLEPTIGVFHRFIQRGLVEGLILDVADYRHVPGGPGVLLVGHDVDYGLSHDAFTAVRKRCGDQEAAVQLRDLLRMALGALDALAEHGGLDGVEVDTSSFTVQVSDRSLGTPAQVAEALLEEVEPVVADVYGGAATVGAVEHDDPREAPSVRVEVPDEMAAGALERLGGRRAPHQSPWDISARHLARLRDERADLVLLDVREESEHETVNIGGTLAPLAELGERVRDLDRDATVVVHCRSGTRGADAVVRLREAGFTDAWNVNGGLMAWIDDVDPSLPRS